MLVEQPGTGDDSPHGKFTVDRNKGGIRHVRGEQCCRCEAAVVLEVRHRGRKVQSHRDPNRGLERARDDDGKSGLGRNRERCGDSAERLRLKHEDVCGTGTRHGERVVGLAHALVCSDRDAHVLHPRAHLRQFVNARTRLLDVFEVVLGEGVDGVLGFVHVPTAVRVEPDASLGSKVRTRRGNARRVIREFLSNLGDFDFHGAASGEPCQYPRDLAG